MRSDLAKKLVERPRYGGGGNYNLRSAKREGKNPEKWESLPQKESCKSVNIRNYKGKYQSEYFAPLRGLLLKNVGRPWDKVNSEIREQLSASSTIHKHVLDHLYGDFVETSPIWRDGKPHYRSFGYNGRLTPITSTQRRASFYVDPHGLLKKAKIEKRKPYVAPKRKEINALAEYRQLGDGVWFYVRYERLFTNEIGYDVVLKKEFKPAYWGCSELEYAHGGHGNGFGKRLERFVRIAVEKRQLSKKEIRDLELNDL